MRIDLQSLQSIQPDTYIKANNQTDQYSKQTQFSDQFKQALEQLNSSQIESGLKTEMLVNGQIDQLHDVMITAQKASLSMSLAVEVQSKVIDAYNEIMRMQI
ncbi:MAG TPA: flagellar hook-basal body complex protein FliE [Bacilli bacterium]|uniref:Flagellar hook-basal body complex protein FliE n=1 Tax=Amphibacillus indicireducens TaxID=1076330 RepID=A0ABP7V5Z8_9BACI|nr:flagellar hook-basal body complex protein FliE [Bacilli bacterium]